jgi:hypothetical protein
MRRIKLLAVALMTGAIAVGTQSCSSDDESGDVKVTGITVTPENHTLMAGGTFTLTAAVFPGNASDKSVAWESNNTGVATVDANGVVTAVAAGEANITVTSVANSARSATCEITVTDAYNVLLDQHTLQVAIGGTGALVATIAPLASKTITWSSSDNTVATVDNGTVTGVAVGTVTITAALQEDPSRKDECVVTVVGEDDLLVGVWTFEDDTNLEKATKGADLEIGGGGYTPIEGPGGTKAVTPGENAYITIKHNIGANGSGGQNTNIYTLMMDIRGSQSDFNGWLSVFDANSAEITQNEGDLWIDGSGAIGYEELGGYSASKLMPDTWHRVVIAANLAEESFLVYIDGTLVFTATPKGDTKNYHLDSRVSLDPEKIYIGTDGTGYSGPQFAEVRMWSVQLSAEEIAALGTPVTP